jgi:putative transposase
VKRSRAGDVRNVSVLVAAGIGMDGSREILDVREGPKEDTESRPAA